MKKIYFESRFKMKQIADNEFIQKSEKFDLL